ncbi:MAG: hypothetical protein AAF340_01575 [Pseudomonadota bacterium]
MSDGPDAPHRRTEFLQRSVYRRRRLLDGLRVLPLLGLMLFLLPAVLLAGGPGTTAIRLIYFFITWAGLILVCALLVRRLSDADEDR